MQWGKGNYKEWLFQGVFLILLFAFYSYDKYHPGFEWHKLVFFLSYAAYALVISYVFLPRYLYKKKYGQFGIAVLVIFGIAYLLEELFFEKLLFDDDRAAHVSNVIYTLLDIVPIIITMVSFKLAWDAHQKQIELEQMRSMAQESELRFLKSQINPHFLFNNLNNLYAYAIENSTKTPSIILELSTVLRYILYDCKADFVPLSAEVDHLKHFTGLNELQIEHRGEVHFSAAIENDGFVIAPLILTMFVENAFKHSTASQSKAIFIDISVEVSEQGELSFFCENSFSELANHDNLSSGIGLENVKKRLEILYPQLHQLEINETTNRYRVKLNIQLSLK